MNLSREVAVLIGCLGLTNCGGPGPTMPPDPACLKDLWLSGEAVPLSCSCLSSSPQPECKETDCEQRGLLWLAHPDFEIEGYLFLSRTRGTFSSAATARYSYFVDGGTLQVDPPKRAAARWECGATTLVVGNVQWSRASAGMSASLDHAYDGGEWSSAPIDGGGT